MRNQSPRSRPTHRRWHRLRGFSETDDRPFMIQRRLLFYLQDSADREFAGEFPIRAQRMCINCLHWRKTRFEIEIEKRQQHLIAGEVFPLRRHAARMPKRLLIRGLESMIVGIEWLETLRSVGSVGRS